MTKQTNGLKILTKWTHFDGLATTYFGAPM